MEPEPRSIGPPQLAQLTLCTLARNWSTCSADSGRSRFFSRKVDVGNQPSVPMRTSLVLEGHVALLVMRRPQMRGAPRTLQDGRQCRFRLPRMFANHAKHAQRASRRQRKTLAVVEPPHLAARTPRRCRPVARDGPRANAWSSVTGRMGRASQEECKGELLNC